METTSRSFAYIEVAAARLRSEPCLVLTEGVAGPWGEAAKAILGWKGIEFIAVRQTAMAANEELAAWTGQTSAPVLMLQGESPHRTLREILFAAERLHPTKPLMPREFAARAELLGLCGEIHAEMGLGWCRRLMMVDRFLHDKELGASGMAGLDRLAWKYGYVPGSTAQARERVVEILHGLSVRLDRQEEAGIPFLYGETLTALDLFWATFSNMVVPLSPEDCPMPEHQRASYTLEDPEILAMVGPALLGHRDRILRDVIGLPLVF